MNTRTIQLTALTFLALSCTGPSGTGQGATAPAVTSERAEAPVFVSWVVQSSDEHSVSLVARIDRRVGMTLPLSVAVIAPPSVKLAAGELSFVLPPSANAEVTERSLSFTFDSVPAEDLRLVADAQSASFGVHAEAAYRFGRPAPSVPVPTPSGSELNVGGHGFGQGIPIK